MKVRGLFLTLFLTICFSVTSQVDAFDAKILHYLDINGTEKEYNDAYDSMFVMLKKKYTGVDVPESFWAKIQADKAEEISKVKKMLSFAYRNNFTEKDIVKMTQFYETETGKKLVINPNSLTEAQKSEVTAYTTSEIGQKMETKRASLANDIKTISQDWRRELFLEKMTALTKFGYKPLKPEVKKKEAVKMKKPASQTKSKEALAEKAKSAKLANPDNKR